MKTTTRHRCSRCGATSPQWLGRCAACGTWGSLELDADAETDAPPAAVPMAAVDPAGAQLHPTGISELDRVLGGGLVAGSVTLIGGEPGIGKSTLCLQAARGLVSEGRRALLVCAEESPEQVRRRADRLDLVTPELLVLGATSLGAVRAAIETTAPGVVVVDSVQTIADADVAAPPGSVVQVRDCTQQLASLARARSVTMLLVGHVTKEGVVAGPRVLEHLVDTVLSFEGDRRHELRVLRALKHRFASTDEVGLFELGAGGLVDVTDPSARLLADARAMPGSVIAPVLSGARPLLVEVQALVGRTAGPVARRVATGIDTRRVDQLVAVLERRARVTLDGADLYVSAAGGARITEAGADLAVAAAIVGARTDRRMRAHTVALGEVGLGGEVRSVSQPARRLAESARMGYRRAVVPESSPPSQGIELIRVATVAEALPAVLDDV